MNARSQSHRFRPVLVAASSATALLTVMGTAAAAPLPGTTAAHAIAPAHAKQWAMEVMRDGSGNRVETVPPAQSTYVPNVAAATSRARTRAQNILDGVNRFCRNHTAKGIKANWRPGTSKSKPTHYFSPQPDSQGVKPGNPAAALIYDGRLGGLMFTGSPLPWLGSIPRAHLHDMSMAMGTMGSSEMVHVYCSTSLKQAFTPNRVLGVKAATIALRLKIRPAVMDLNERQLREVRARVRHFAGDRLAPVYPTGTSTDGGPDPVLQAMRTEIRLSLMILHERQLRRVWHLMQSY